MIWFTQTHLELFYEGLEGLQVLKQVNFVNLMMWLLRFEAISTVISVKIWDLIKREFTVNRVVNSSKLQKDQILLFSVTWNLVIELTPLSSLFGLWPEASCAKG